jgi:APA family basic amino acid/polyamine antiporter
VALMAAASLVFAASGTYESIVRIYAPWSIGAILIVCLAAIRLRITEPDLPRPWRMPLFPWIAVGAVAIQASLIAIFVWDDPLAGAGSAIIAFAPLLVFLWWARSARRKAERALGQK